MATLEDNTMSGRFQAMIVREDGGSYTRSVEEREIADLPDGDVIIRVHYSSLNYKDALSATGHRGVTKQYPHTPGVDAAGEVVSSRLPDLKPGDPVTVTDYDLGMNTPGGWGEAISVPAGWVVPLPDGLTMRESMAIGTAGLTSALSVLEITRSGITPDRGDILVTGATGGVGSFAVAILAQAGFGVVAATGKPVARPYLMDLGASEVIDRQNIDPHPDRPMNKGRYAGVVDTVGGDILAGAMKSVLPGGAVTCCGLVASPDLKTTVYPFILRGIRLIGVDCAECPVETRRILWEKLAGEWKIDMGEEMVREVALTGLENEIEGMLAGKSKGRVVVGHGSVTRG